MVTWSFGQGAGSFYAFAGAISATLDMSSVRQAFDAWENVAQIDFVEVADSMASNIRLGWSKLDGVGGQIGEAAWAPSAQGTTTHSEVVFDIAEIWSAGPVAGAINLFAVALHEIGHSLGLGHADEIGSIMYPYLNNQGTLAPVDIAAIQAIYGPSVPNLPPVHRYGTPAADVLTGTAANDDLNGLGGNDSISGSLGDDRLKGGLGDDRLSGDDGNDVLRGEDGNDELHGGGGKDNLDGGVGDDLLFGDDGADVLNGGAGDDRLNGGRDDDFLAGSEGDDVLDGSTGNDELHGGNGRDILSGGGGDDVLSGGAGDDTLIGGAGTDRLSGGTGRNILWGDAGNDILSGGSDQDVLRGGDGEDMIFGNLGRDLLYGGAGNDIFEYRSVEDSLAGAASRDRIFDWTSGDRIDFRRIVSDTLTAHSDSPDAFQFVGTDAFSAIGQIRYAIDAVGNTIVQVNVDSDTATADFEIELNQTVVTLTASDFLL
ncbi:hypothetical protein ASG54_05680 [Aureimonas sp. Leaf460]|nr:hypothetical protein ASG62_00155 [Aureimonas sp. Leaf427]KQT80946.1 hypothetical protein ASG54_05680 [Aureimonas sp. Leaf460]